LLQTYLTTTFYYMNYFFVALLVCSGGLA